jgi:hypothetical protein
MARDLSALTKELDRSAGRQNRSSGPSDFSWFNPPKPVRNGEKTRTQIRILPRKDARGEWESEYWVRADQHVLQLDGKTKVLNCPDNHDDGDSAKTCPLCALRRELYSERSPEAQALAKDLRVRSRCFAVVALTDPDAGAERGPFVWGYGSQLNDTIIEIAVAKRCFIDDPATGRDMLLTTTRIGPKKMDIRYSVTDLDSTEVPPDVGAMLSRLPDLRSLTKVATNDELRNVAALVDPRPAGKRASVVSGGSAPAVRHAPAPVEDDVEDDVAPEAAPVVEIAPHEPDVLYHYSGPEEDAEGLTAAEIAQKVFVTGGDNHHCWQDGWAEWKPCAEVREIAEAVKALRVPTVVKRPPGPPGRPAGPPRPPRPPGGAAF